ncbi:MAG: hypothetical protein ACMUEL_03210 [Flavobacteriales bacterium Tduv]
MIYKYFSPFSHATFSFRIFGVENKKFGSMLRNTVQLSFSELYM